jgi:hypothetical protein
MIFYIAFHGLGQTFDTMMFIYNSKHILYTHTIIVYGTYSSMHIAHCTMHIQIQTTKLEVGDHKNYFWGPQHMQEYVLVLEGFSKWVCRVQFSM